MAATACLERFRVFSTSATGPRKKTAAAKWSTRLLLRFNNPEN
jgi:hypothetical protein